MIYTVTLNPSLDYIVTVQDFAMGKTNRTLTEEMLPGGKGINVSIMLHNLGQQSTALGFTAGFTGEEIEKKTGEMGFLCDFIRVDKGFSRINVKMKDFEGTEINGQGPVIEEEHVRKFYAKLEKMQQGDILVLAGSVPKGMSGTSYRDMLEWISGKGILCVVDATGEALLNVLPYRPFLVKPNHHELGEIFGVEINDREEAVPYAKKMQELGARNVLVSLAGKGAVLAAENGEVYLEEAPKGRLVNAVGAGDSMVAGFLAGWLENSAKYRHAFKMAVAAGSASAFSAGFAEREEVMRLYAGENGDEAFEI